MEYIKIFPHCADSFELLHSENLKKKHWFLPSSTLYFFLILVYWKGPKVIGLWKEGCFGSNFKWAVKFALILSFILVTKSIYIRVRLKIYLYDLVLLCNSPEISNYSQTEMIKQIISETSIIIEGKKWFLTRTILQVSIFNFLWQPPKYLTRRIYI